MRAFADRDGLSGHDLSLDWLRGIAAVLVLLAHVRGGFFVLWPDLDAEYQTVFNHALFLVTRLGPQAVMIFFVLSGYLVGGQAILAARSNRYSLRHYLVSRASRLYTVLIPALLLTAAMDVLSGRWSSSADGWRPFVLNLFFLQEIVGLHYGSNVPLWSLAYEWWFYVLFGLGLFVYVRESIPLRSVGVGLLALLVLGFLIVYPPIFSRFPLWLGGAAIAAMAARPTRVSRPLVLLSIVLLCICMGISTQLVGMQGDYLVGAGTLLLLWMLRGADPIRDAWPAAGHTLASFSFTLYAVHQPLNALLDRLFVPHRLTRAGLVEWLALLVLTLGITCYAFGLYWIFERNTPRIRSWLLPLLRRARSSVLEASPTMARAKSLGAPADRAKG